MPFTAEYSEYSLLGLLESTPYARAAVWVEFATPAKSPGAVSFYLDRSMSWRWFLMIEDEATACKFMPDTHSSCSPG